MSSLFLLCFKVDGRVHYGEFLSSQNLIVIGKPRDLYREELNKFPISNECAASWAQRLIYFQTIPGNYDPKTYKTCYVLSAVMNRGWTVNSHFVMTELEVNDPELCRVLPMLHTQRPIARIDGQIPSIPCVITPTLYKHRRDSVDSCDAVKDDGENIQTSSAARNEHAALDAYVRATTGRPKVTFKDMKKH
jgi:hypothetical protein